MGVFDRDPANRRGKKGPGSAVLVPDINALEPELTALSDDDLRPQDRRVPRAPRPESAGRRLRRPQRPADRVVRRRSRGGPPRPRPAPLRRPADGRRRPPLRLDRRDEDRRGQDPRVDPAVYLNALDAARRAPRHRQRLPGQARRRVDGPGPPVPRPHRRASSPRDRRPRGEEGRPTTATSPTAPTPSSASTTCGTTWPSRERMVAAGPRLRASSTRSTRSSSTRPAPR